mgnify:CR=1 FL=1
MSVSCKEMNVIFLTMSRIGDISERGIYTDLLRKFRDEGHNVYVVTPRERRMGLPTELVNVNDNLNLNENDNGKVRDVYVLGVRTLLKDIFPQSFSVAAKIRKDVRKE